MRIFLAVLWLSIPLAASEITLSIGPAGNFEVERLPSGVVDLEVAGPGAHFWSSVVTADFEPGTHSILEFECFSPSGIKSLSVRYRQPGGEMILAASQPVPLAESWQPVSFDLSSSKIPLRSPDEKSRFHFALKHQPGAAFQIRNLRLREPNEEERMKGEEHERIAAQRELDAKEILAYYRGEYASRIHEVLVGKETVLIRGYQEGEGLLRELRSVHPSHAHSIPEEPVRKDLSGEFEVTVPRFVSAQRRDRLHSRWRLETADGGIASVARWGRVETGVAKNLPKLEAKSQKGLGGIPLITSDEHEIFELGIKHATINVVLNALLSDRPRPGMEKIVFEGTSYFLNRRFLQQREATVRHLCNQGIIVTAILLIGNQAESALTHPEAEPRGIFAMPNLKTEDGAKYYRAALYVLGNHFTQPGKRIANWVIHNEIDQGGTWTNMGDQPMARYLETYHRSARLVYQAMRVRDPHARVFISLTHHWTKPSLGKGAYTVRNLLELFAEMGRGEGDFEWGVAYHPYPQNLRNPDAWLDEGVSMTFETPYITPKNFEVLPFYLQQERLRFEGRARGILFSEQGFNSPTLSKEDQRRQVAGIIYQFRHLEQFPVIEAYHLHRYQDMPDREGGLRLGIVDENGNRKLAWEAYRTLGTPEGRKYEEIADEVMRASSSR